MNCIWCESTVTRLLRERVSKYRGIMFDIWGCEGCGCRFSPWGPLAAYDYEALQQQHAWYRLLRCDAQMVHAILANGTEPFWVNWAARYLNRIPWSLDGRYRAVLENLMAAAASGRRLRVVEVGCNRGLLGGIAARLGHDYVGVDVAGGVIDEAVDRFGPMGARFRAVSVDWFDSAEDQETFDLVFSLETVEHAPYPGRFCQRLVRLVAPGGKLIFTTPDLESSPGRLWRSGLPPLHTVLLRKSSIETLLARIEPGGRTTCYNEDFGPSGGGAEPTDSGELFHPDGTTEMDPNDPAFFAHVRNLNEPVLPIEPRDDPAGQRARDARLADALVNGRRDWGTTIVTEHVCA